MKRRRIEILYRIYMYHEKLRSWRFHKLLRNVTFRNSHFFGNTLYSNYHSLISDLPFKGFEYSRSGNPTRVCLEKCLAAAEGAKHGIYCCLVYFEETIYFILLKWIIRLCILVTFNFKWVHSARSYLCYIMHKRLNDRHNTELERADPGTKVEG